MNKSILLVVIIVILLAAGGGVFFATHKSNESQTTNTTKVSVAPTKEMAKTQSGSLKDLLSLKTPQKCTYSTEHTSAAVSGTTYIANSKMRGDFTSKAGEAMTGHMIVDSGYVYIWTDASKQGMKMAIPKEEPTVSQAQTSQTAPSNQNADLNQAVSYSCSAWSEDDSMFALPKDINFEVFVAPSIVIPSAGSSSKTNSQAACSACANLPSSDQATCKAQLHCQ